MDTKKTDIPLSWFLSFLSFSALILYPAGQRILFLFPIFTISILLLPGGSLFIRRRYIFIYLFTNILIFFLIIRIQNASLLWTGVPMDCVNSITGYVVYDSSFTQSNNHMMTIFLTEAKSIYGQTVSAKGLVNVIGDERAIITSGIKITLNGRFNGELFKYKSLQILSRTQINNIREYLIVEIEKRLGNDTYSEPALLSIMLILGRADSYNNSIKKSAQQCGCSHVLALSGMHLNTIQYIFLPFKSKTLKTTLTVIAATIFVFIAGPRPSLIRAFLMLVFKFLPTVERLVIVFILQAILFPFSIINTGCIFSYLAIFALTFIAPVMNINIGFLKPFITSASVLFLIAPVDLITTESWTPLAIILSPVLGVLILASMFIGFALLMFGPMKPLSFLNNFVYRIIQNLFDYFSQFPKLGWKEYFIFASVIIVLLFSGVFYKLILKHRFKKINKTHIIKT